MGPDRVSFLIRIRKSERNFTQTKDEHEEGISLPCQQRSAATVQGQSLSFLVPAGSKEVICVILSWSLKKFTDHCKLKGESH